MNSEKQHLLNLANSKKQNSKCLREFVILSNIIQNMGNRHTKKAKYTH